MLFSFHFLYAKHIDDKFTHLKLNEQIATYDDTLLTKGHMYFFLKPDECFACFSHILYLYELCELYDINCVGFVDDLDQDGIIKFKTNKNIPFRLVSDKMDLYKRFYKIRSRPVYILLDKGGRFIAADKCGGTNISDKDINTLLSKLKSNSSQNIHNMSKLLEIRRVLITDNGEPVKADKVHSILYSNTNKNMIIQNTNYLELIFVDSLGVCYNKLDLNELGHQGITPRKPLSLSWIEENKSILCNDISDAMDWGFYSLDINSKKANYINYKYPYPPYNVSGSIYNPIANTIVLGLTRSLMTDDPSFIDTNFNTLMIIDNNGKEIRRFGKPNELFQKFKISHMYHNRHIDIDDIGNIYEFQAPSNTINIYDKKGNYIRYFDIDFGENYRFIKDNLEPIKDVLLKWRTWNSKTSICRDLRVNNRCSEVLIVYSNVEYPVDIEDPKSSDALRKFYLHKSNFNSKRICDIQIPAFAQVIDTCGDDLILLEIANGFYNIVQYKILN